MKNENSYVKKLIALLKKIRSTNRAESHIQHDAVTQLVIAYLEWNATRKSAKDAHARLMRVMVDNNDLRVSHPHEIVAILGERYPRAEERAARLHEALQEIYLREHAIEVDLSDKSKKQVRTYFDSLPGITQYVAAQVTLLACNSHAIPVDDHMADLLREEGVVDPAATVEEIGAFLERCVKADDAVEVHLCMRAWADGRTTRSKPAKPAKSTKKPKSTKKSSKNKR